MSRIRNRDTKPELHLRSLLHRSGFRFRVNEKKLPGCPDVVLKKFNAVIFVHGCFWHRHPHCPNATTPSTRPRFWQEKFKNTVARDNNVNRTLSELGWKVLIVWECELSQNPESVLAYISKELQSKSGLSTAQKLNN